MKIGYVRVSKQGQHEAFQIDALKEHLDKMTRSKAERKGLDEAIVYVHPGDMLPKVRRNPQNPKFTAFGISKWF